MERLGHSKSVSVDVRIIAATNRDLDKSVRKKQFRDDSVLQAECISNQDAALTRTFRRYPSLLVQSFVNEFAKAFGKGIESIDKDSIDTLQRYTWPGNIRELAQYVERAMILTSGPRLYIDPPITSSNDAASQSASQRYGARAIT